MEPRRRLVLDRIVGESIEIGDNITVTLHQIRGSKKAKLLIEAPDSVIVDRSEVRRSKEMDNG